MTINLVWLHMGLAALLVLVAYRWNVNTLRLKAKYDLYQVRDKLVMLVASNALDEDSAIFQHYYSRINGLLKCEPYVGLQALLNVAFRAYKPGHLAAELERARIEIAKLAESPDAKKAEVRVVIAEYYGALRAMVLSHSSALFIWYLFCKQMIAASRGPIRERQCKPARQIVPPSINDGFAAVNYAKKQEDRFSGDMPLAA